MKAPMIVSLLLLLSGFTVQQGLAQETGAPLSVRALVKAKTRLEYRSSLDAAVKAINFKQGDRFEKGSLIFELECSRHIAEEQAAAASAKASSIELNKLRKLLKYKAVGKTEVQIASARTLEAQAQLEMLKVRNRLCSFEAPFEGRVVELNVNPFEYPPSDQPMIVMIDDSILEMELVVPSKWLVWFRQGSEFSIKIDETGEVGSGKIERIAAEVDPVSQTVRAIATFTEKPASVLSGMSGNVVFESATN